MKSTVWKSEGVPRGVYGRQVRSTDALYWPKKSDTVEIWKCNRPPGKDQKRLRESKCSWSTVFARHHIWPPAPVRIFVWPTCLPKSIVSREIYILHLSPRYRDMAFKSTKPKKTKYRSFIGSQQIVNLGLFPSDKWWLIKSEVVWDSKASAANWAFCK